MCVLKRAPCWYAIEVDVWRAGFDWALGLGGEEGILRDPVHVIFGHFKLISTVAFLCSHPLLLP